MLLTCAVVVSGCSSKKKKGHDKPDRAKVASLLSTEAPSPQHPLDIQFGDQFALVGYDTSSETAQLDKPVQVTWYFKVLKKPSAEWKLFTHVADGAGVSRINLDRNGAIRKNWQPENWEPGSYVKDPQSITLPKDWKSDKAVLFVGFWKGSERLPVKGPNDGKNRARALELNVGSEPSTPEVLPELVSSEAKGPIKLDGKLDEAVWKDAASTNALVNTMTGAPAEPKVQVKSAWDAKNLYVAFEVADPFLKSTFANNDDHLWEQDCVEIMLDPDGDGKNYFELQVSPQNKWFDTRYDSRRQPKPFGHMDWNAGLKSGVTLNGKGKVNDDKPDEGYTVEIAIPWTAFEAGEPKHTAPKAGDKWHANFYVMDALEHDMRSVGWSPPKVGDFHMPKRFGTLVFAGASSEAEKEVVKGDEKPAAEGEKKSTEKAAKKKPAATDKAKAEATP
jgi:hypothetical protein